MLSCSLLCVTCFSVIIALLPATWYLVPVPAAYCLLSATWCLVLAACFRLVAAGYLLSITWCLLHVTHLLPAWYLRPDACCLLAVWCLIVCSLLSAVCCVCLLLAAYYLLSVDSCLLRVNSCHCILSTACCLLPADCFMPIVCLLFTVWCIPPPPSVAFCLISASCCLLPAAWCVRSLFTALSAVLSTVYSLLLLAVIICCLPPCSLLHAACLLSTVTHYSFHKKCVKSLSQKYLGAFFCSGIILARRSLSRVFFNGNWEMRYFSR